MKLIYLTLTLVVVFGLVQAQDGFGYELIMSVLEAIQTKDRQIATKIEQVAKAVIGESSCPEHVDNGVFNLKPAHSSIPAFPAYCEEGWIVIHRRFNGSVHFNRTWHDYREGFGDLQGEYWLGLEKMHQITRGGSFELMVVLKNISDVEKRSKFGGFRIASEFKQYQLELTKFIEGDAGDSIMEHNGMEFSTPDRNNVVGHVHCGTRTGSGWWFTKCFRMNLNHSYKEKISFEGIFRNPGYEPLKEARMIIRAVESKNKADLKFE